MVALAESAAAVDADALVSSDADASPETDPFPDAPASPNAPTRPDAPAIPRPVSEAQLRANRANARKSTGPKTPAGKKRSSENALVHGLRAASILVPGEDPCELTEYRISIICTIDPRNPIEMEYVEQVIRAGWKLRRYQGAELELLEDQIRSLKQPSPNGPGAAALVRALWGGPEFGLLMRYEQQYTRMMSRAMDDLRKLKKDPIYGTLGDFAGEMIAAEKAQLEELEALETEAQEYQQERQQEHQTGAPTQNAPNEANPEMTAVNHAASEAYDVPGMTGDLASDLRAIKGRLEAALMNAPGAGEAG